MKLFAAACLVAASLVSLVAQEEGTVLLDVVVTADGAVSDVKVATSLDSVFGLDREAVKAMREWKFRPAAKDGKNVAVQVAVQMTFTLK